jgi:hypothetical protein
MKRHPSLRQFSDDHHQGLVNARQQLMDHLHPRQDCLLRPSPLLRDGDTYQSLPYRQEGKC